MEYFIFNHFKFLFDPLSLFFLAVIALVCAPSLIYSFGYLKGQFSSSRINLLQALTVLFIGSMAAVVLAGDILFFLIAWELMSLVSFFLVIFEHEHEQSITAGVIYIVMTHVGTAFIIAACALIYKFSGTFNFEVVRNACLLMPQHIRNLIFIFLLIGFGTKAGIVPLHVWLPYAHPQAPSHISSMMSGVMIKTAVYGIIRFVMFLLGANTGWWGVLILILAVLSCLVGVIYALMEQDIKKLLAYSSVENMGIILLGVGLSMLFYSMNLRYPAVLALVAGLYHLINHAVFKGLLFLGAGSVYKATGTRNMEKMGGLIKSMPWTAAFFLLGAMAISGLPPFNGFISEWLVLQAFFLGGIGASGVLKLFLGLGAAALAFTSGLAAACFVKAFGITFLALPRSKQAQQAKEALGSMLTGMGIFAGLIIILGAAAVPVIKILAVVAGYANSVDIQGMPFSLNNFTLSIQPAQGVFLSPGLIALSFLIFGAGSAGAYFLLFRQGTRIFKTWDCGYYKLDSRNEYTSTGFSKPFRLAFSFFLLPYKRTQKIRESAYHVKSFSYETYTTKVFKKYFYEPLLYSIYWAAAWLRRIQPGSIHLYIGYILLTIILLIVFIKKF